MARINRTDLSFLLEDVAKEISITDSYFDEAKKKYKAVGAWLGEEGSPLAIYSPVIFPQGSFLLGTTIKPIGEKDEYDIDLVLELALSKYQVTQKILKNLVGDRLKQHEVYRRLLDEGGRRCWTLVYADSARFHLDILPSVPNDDYREFLRKQGVVGSWAETGIAITDKTLPNYDRLDPNWPSCNPKGYAAWFRSRMIVQFEEQRKHLAMELKADIDCVPEYKIKTPLQISVQLLKRHRDVSFSEKEDKPASIIITTLAAQAYNNEIDVFEALTNIANGMPEHIKIIDGKSWIQNPVDPSENFADRWQDRPGREQEFRSWLKKANNDVNSLLNCVDIDRICELLEGMFGEKVATSAVLRYKERARERGRITNSVVPIIKPNPPWGI